MAKRKIDLIKTILSNQKAKSTQDDSFKEIALSKEEFNDEKIKNIYEDLFYVIPKRGEDAHEDILVQSSDINNPEINQRLEKDIRVLEEQLLDLDEEYLEKTLPELISQHPLFPNGIFLQEGNVSDNSPLDPNSQMWFVQQGFRRPIKGSNIDLLRKILRKSVGDKVVDLAGNPRPLSPPIIRYAIPEEIMSIKEAQDILNAEDLSITPIIAKDEQTPIFSTLKVSLFCEGEEKFYVDPTRTTITAGIGGNLPGYWYLDQEGHCEITFKRDLDPSFTFEGEEITKIWKAGTYIGTTLSRDASFYSHGDPLNPTFYLSDPDVEEKPITHSNPPSVTFNYYKDWGEGTKFPSITHVKQDNTGYSRIKVQIQQPSTGTGGGPLREGYHLLSGIDNENPPQLNILTGAYNEESYWGTRMIYKNCYGPLSDQCYGALNQPSSLQEHLSNPTFRYYEPYIDTPDFSEGKMYTPIARQKVYGQPILKIKDGDGNFKAWVVFMGGYRKGTTDRSMFYDLVRGTWWNMKQNQLHKTNKDHVSGYREISNRVFTWFEDSFRSSGYNASSAINNPKVYFPGLQGERLNWQWTDLDMNMYDWVTTMGGTNADLRDFMIMNQTRLQLFTMNPHDVIAPGVGSNFYATNKLKQLISGI